MMEAARTSGMLVNFSQTTRRYNPEDCHLQTHLNLLYVSEKYIFQRHCNETKGGVCASYRVAERLAKKGKPFTDAEFIKSCISATVEELCPERTLVFQCAQ
jgi:hypothetical protein